MIEMKFTLLMGLVYTSQVKCSSVDDLIAHLQKYFGDEQYELKRFSKRASELIKKLSTVEGTIAWENALNVLISADLKEVLGTLHEQQRYLVTHDVEHYKKAITSEMKKWGIKITPPKVFVVKKFPKPYEKQIFWVMQFDQVDERNYGIPQGIYFDEKYLAPFITPFLLAHEIVHRCLSYVEGNNLGPLMEEGIADFFAIYMTIKAFGLKAALNLAVNLRFFYPFEQLYLAYTDALRMALLIYKHIGISGYFEIIKKCQEKGRAYLYRVEEVCLSGQYGKLPIRSTPTYFKDLNLFCDYFLAYPSSLAISPLSFYIAERIKIGDSINNFLERINIDGHKGRKALKSLEDSLFLILIDKDKDVLLYDRTKAYFKAHVLRYQFSARAS
jgi:hypothetical protein